MNIALRIIKKIASSVIAWYIISAIVITFAHTLALNNSADIINELGNRFAIVVVIECFLGLCYSTLKIVKQG